MTTVQPDGPHYEGSWQLTNSKVRVSRVLYSKGTQNYSIFHCWHFNFVVQLKTKIQCLAHIMKKIYKKLLDDYFVYFNDLYLAMLYHLFDIN